MGNSVATLVIFSFFFAGSKVPVACADLVILIASSLCPGLPLKSGLTGKDRFKVAIPGIMTSSLLPTSLAKAVTVITDWPVKPAQSSKDVLLVPSTDLIPIGSMFDASPGCPCRTDVHDKNELTHL
ncbi:hypothetical protein [Endozoicomonas sp. SCSIO W0465]|uniref:hypothetical protein n=1 Tax=Endozoicomonas sp. SCSIO W0465 TaxID=2918516 RepID=UPI0020760FBC|nr:hypothetical protein [Endozoicomonas sp. SCSIO W0465]USE34235.1 hypothetical protein MJO57_18980 [Endozoicomonas sp. SCSIO W0465]